MLVGSASPVLWNMNETYEKDQELIGFIFAFLYLRLASKNYFMGSFGHVIITSELLVTFSSNL